LPLSAYGCSYNWRVPAMVVAVVWRIIFRPHQTPYPCAMPMFGTKHKN